MRAFQALTDSFDEMSGGWHSVVWHEERLDRRLSVFLTTRLDAPFISSILASDRSSRSGQFAGGPHAGKIEIGRAMTAPAQAP